MMHVSSPPAMTLTAWTPSGRSTCTGRSCEPFVPIPSCPWALSPQHETLPLRLAAQACDAPAVMLVTSERATAVGTGSATSELARASCEPTAPPHERTAPSSVMRKPFLEVPARERAGLAIRSAHAGADGLTPASPGKRASCWTSFFPHDQSRPSTPTANANVPASVTASASSPGTSAGSGCGALDGASPRPS